MQRKLIQSCLHIKQSFEDEQELKRVKEEETFASGRPDYHREIHAHGFFVIGYRPF